MFQVIQQTKLLPKLMQNAVFKCWSDFIDLVKKKTIQTYMGLCEKVIAPYT